MPPEIAFTYEFFPVGQGLFSHGTLRRPRHQDLPIFRWVYDCGTVSQVIDQRISDALDLMTNGAGGRDQLDLLFISHFDKDHINGITKLLARVKKVGIIVLPYVRFERLVLFAVEGGVDSNDPVFGFFIDPVGYLTGLEGVMIEQILFVMPGGESDAYDVDETPPTDPAGKVVFSREPVTFPRDSTEAAFITNADKHGKDTMTSFLVGGTTLRIDALWEFVPYNADLGVDLPLEWVKKVEDKRNALARSASIEQRSVALFELKELYKAHFGKKNENAISLHVYAGPITRHPWHGWYELVKRTIPNDTEEHHYCRCHWHGNHAWRDRPKLSLLYTGDGNLKPTPNLNRMIEFFKQGRIDRCAVLQVMHHGSRNNWHKGLAACIAPCFSIFSSEPTRGRTYHPHAEVVKDFLPYGPIQVDTSRWCQFHGWLHP